MYAAIPWWKRDHLVWIFMGDPARASATAPYDSHWHDAQGWRAERGGYIRYQANMQLIVDNLLDFSHLAFGAQQDHRHQKARSSQARG